MSEHKVTLEWKRGTEDFSYESYSRIVETMYWCLKVALGFLPQPPPPIVGIPLM